jgi:two-component system, OmpR family, KDP operon response regulator KdpE
MAAVTLIEDDRRIAHAVVRELGERGHSVEVSSTGMDVDGTELLKMLRAVSQVPVIAATARDEDAEVVRTLDLGADDYIVKPYSAAQLDARIRAVLRRSSGTPERPALEIGGLRIDVRAREATLDGRYLELARKEFDLLVYLADRAGTVVSKQELLAEVWRQPWGGSDKTVDVHVSWLRRKFGETAAEPVYLHTVRGVGLKLQAP